MELFLFFLGAAVIGGFILHYRLSKTHKSDNQDTVAPYKLEPVSTVEVKETTAPPVEVKETVTPVAEIVKEAVKVKTPRTKSSVTVKKQLAETKTDANLTAKKTKKTRA